MYADEKKFTERAVALAAENVRQSQGGPFGALIVKYGKIIAEAANSVTADNDPTAHAEINAIRKACDVLGTYNLSGCIIYTSCEPCPMCLGAIYWARINKLVFAARSGAAAKAGFDDAFFYEELKKHYTLRSIPTENLEIASAELPFELWNATTNKTSY